jgi:hypothetical protein
MWKETAVPYFKVSQHILVVTEEKRKPSAKVARLGSEIRTADFQKRMLEL